MPYEGEPSLETMRGQLANAVAAHAGLDQTIWEIFGIFWAATAILLVALFTTGSFPTNPWVGVIVSGVGLILSAGWCLIQRRALGHLELLKNVIENIERALNIPADCATSRHINTSAYAKYVEGSGRTKVRSIMKAFSVWACGLWALSLMVFLGWVIAR